MRKIIFLMMVSFSCAMLAQETTTEISNSFKKNELKGNALLLVLGSFDVTYERILNEESGVGISVNIPFDDYNWDLNYSVTGFYRYYFGKKPGAGFFGEAFGMFNNVDDYVYEEVNGFYEWEQKKLTDFALGIGLGGKWITKKGLLLELNGGVGRNLFNNQFDDRDYELIGRVGITVGYRF